jgi:hypothetical protein
MLSKVWTAPMGATGPNAFENKNLALLCGPAAWVGRFRRRGLRERKSGAASFRRACKPTANDMKGFWNAVNPHLGELGDGRGLLRLLRSLPVSGSEDLIMSTKPGDTLQRFAMRSKPPGAGKFFRSRTMPSG